MTTADLIELLKEALALCNAGEWPGEEPTPDVLTRFFARRIHSAAYRFWEQDPVLIAKSLERDNSGANIAKLQNADRAMLGFAMRKQKLDYLDALAGRAMGPDRDQDMSWVDEDGVPQGIWSNFIFDEQLASSAFASLKKSRMLQDLVEIHLPAALLPQWNQVASLETIVWAQHMAIVEYRRLSQPKPDTPLARFIDTRLSITDPSAWDIYVFLAVRDTTEEAYCMQQPGLRQREYDAMKEGTLSLGDIFKLRPAFILRELLPQKASLN